MGSLWAPLCQSIGLLSATSLSVSLLIDPPESIRSAVLPECPGVDYRAAGAIDLIDQVQKNKIKPSVKSGDYIPHTTAAPFQSL